MSVITAATYTYLPDYLVNFLNEAIRFRLHAMKGEAYEVPELNYFSDGSELDELIRTNELSEVEVIALMLALVPHIIPSFLDEIVADFLPTGGDLPDFGGVKAKNHRGMMPTGETLLYILKGNDLGERMALNHYIHVESELFKKGILFIEEAPQGEPKMSGRLLMDDEYIDLLTTGSVQKPKMSSNFPAKLVETDMMWENLVLQNKTLQQIKEIETWLQYNDLVMNEWGLKTKVKPGYRVMFFGPPGTGKTLTAGLLGKYSGRDVYRIDLSLIVSKYIGETEKNLSRLFDKAINKDWILFFDEADSVFGKRTSVRDAHDKYANQEVSYLLQRIEAHPGLVILASNLKNNIDSAFTRRFQSIIEFEVPGVRERLQLWQDNLPDMIPLAEEISLQNISRSFDLTGANIVNIVQYVCLRTASMQRTTISLEHLMEGIRKEYLKEGKIF